MNCTLPAGIPACSAASRSTRAISVLEWMASLPPLRRTALPDFRQRPMASAVTLGRASYTMPMTPRGTRIFVTVRPFGSVPPPRMVPTGSGRAATWRSPSAMPASRSCVSSRRSSMDSFMCPALPASISPAFAARIVSAWSSSASAMVRSAAFLAAVDRVASRRSANPAARACSLMLIMILLSNMVSFPIRFTVRPGHRGG